ncbi:non-specific serine/threonine protein kinase [Crossiella equi]|uniref:Non-specific serine/threonine protein kinase n=1 Tax=Crossiella equi TaxID=130796 RepID=A0ABS5A662_9PSEU|nr:LuxR C-terminal-related transcriptional regulator [Crossiella equi]MBP2471722.1 non-specific serine/threonine protein kinase [Crossiella equi]
MASAAPGNLPVDVTSFVDRRRELARVRQLLGAHRLVMLTGVGGVGKSRLALRVGARVRPQFPDGVWLAELASLQDPGLLAHTVADALGASDHSACPPLEATLAYLAQRRLLLVLDNCEHLVEECAGLVSTLLARAPGLTVLATSRQPLGIAGEHLLPVPPLDVPPDGRAPSTAELREYGSVRLFQARIGVQRLDPVTRRRVAAVCRRLEGIPLAIELAAARLPDLGLDELLLRLDQRFELLTGSGAVLPRQQTLRATVDWSFELCSPAERTLWARLAVCVSGFDLAAAEHIGSGPDLPPGAVLDAVTGLLDKSILTKAGVDGTARYRMLETLRQYGHERLGPDSLELVRRRLLEHYLGVAREFAADWHGPRQALWRRRWDADLGNLRVALEFSLAQPGGACAALELVALLGPYWAACGSAEEGSLWLRRALKAGPAPTRLRARALWVAAQTEHVHGDMLAAVEYLDECESLSRALGAEPELAWAVQYRAVQAMYQGDTVGAVALYTEATRRHRAIGDPQGIILSLAQHALCHCLRSDDIEDAVRQAEALCTELIALAEPDGEVWIRSWGVTLLGLAAWLGGRPAEAERLLLESVRLKREFADRFGLGMALEVLLWITSADGRHTAAACLSGAVESVLAPVGMSFFAISRMTGYRLEAEARIRTGLSAKALEAERRRGADFDLHEAVTFALEELAPKPEAPARLTRRQLEVAELVAQGLSNKEIARELAIAQRTAEAHLEHILARLGLRSRAQVAAWVAARGSR